MKSVLFTYKKYEHVKNVLVAILKLIGGATRIRIGGRDAYDVKSFCAYYEEKRASSQYSDTFNSFTDPLKTDIGKHTKKIENTYEDFKNYF